MSSLSWEGCQKMVKKLPQSRILSDDATLTIDVFTLTINIVTLAIDVVTLTIADVTLTIDVVTLTIAYNDVIRSLLFVF